MSKLLLLTCNNCNKNFKRYRIAKFCSRKCAAVSRSKTAEKYRVKNYVCAYCNEPFYRIGKKRTSKSGLLFCCRVHKDKAQSEQNNFPSICPSHYGTGNSYRKKALKNFPVHCNRCGYKEYPEIIQVHHKDRNRKNNSLTNLELVCPNCHEIEHLLTKSGRFSTHISSAQIATQ